MTFEEDDEMAAVMGFSGFGSTKELLRLSMLGFLLGLTVCVGVILGGGVLGKVGKSGNGEG